MRKAWTRWRRGAEPLPPGAASVEAGPAPERARIIRYTNGDFEEWEADHLEGVKPHIRAGSVLWVDVNTTRMDGIYDSLERDLGVHPLTIEDIRSQQQRPKVEEYPGYLYVVSKMLKRLPNGRLETEQVSILVGAEWLVTFQEGKPGDVFERVRVSLRQARPTARSGGTGHLLYLILDAIIDACFPVLEEFGARAEALEDRILDGIEDGATLREDLQDLRRDLLTVRRIAWPQRDALARLEREEMPLITVETRTFLRDTSDQATRVIDFAETNREIVASLMDLLLANATQRTNEVMKVLTVVSTIFIPLTFLVGWYGMNFEHMPELELWWAYPLLFVITVGIAVSMFLFFKRKRWV